MNHIKSVLFSLLIIVSSCGSHEKELSVLQFNIWQEGTMVENGFDAIVGNIIHVNPDMVTFSEVRNYNEVDFISRLVGALREKGEIGRASCRERV